MSADEDEEEDDDFVFADGETFFAGDGMESRSGGGGVNAAPGIRGVLVFPVEVGGEGGDLRGVDDDESGGGGGGEEDEELSLFFFLSPLLLLLVLFEEEGGVSGAGAPSSLIVSAKEMPPRNLQLSWNFPSQVLSTLLNTNEANIVAGSEKLQMQNGRT